MTKARGTTSKHVMALLLYVMIMTQLTMTSTTSVNRINYEISFQQLRASKIAMSEYVYDYIASRDAPVVTSSDRSESTQNIM